MPNLNLEPTLVRLEDLPASSVPESSGPGEASLQQTEPAKEKIKVDNSAKVKWNQFLAGLFSGKKILQQQKIKAVLDSYDKATTSEEKNSAKYKVASSFIELANENLEELKKNECSLYTRLMYRYALLSGDWIKEPQTSLFNTTPIDMIDEIGDIPCFYADEWMMMVQNGKIRPSKFEDAKSSFKKKSPDAKLNQMYTSIETEVQNLEKNILTREENLADFNDACSAIMDSRLDPSVTQSGPPYEVKINNNTHFEKIRTLMSRMQAIDRYLTGTSDKINKLHHEATILEQKLGSQASTGESKPDALKDEYSAIQEMIKMCVGPRGNDFPVVASQFMGQDIITREMVIEKVKQYQHLDSEMFYWKFQGLESNNCPLIILVPCYGESGFCWEPIDFSNRASGRGKIVIPMYPANTPPDRVIISALAQYRWLKEKELLGTYWMNEGITGNYYMYHEGLKKLKRKGGTDIKFDPDLKSSFIGDYILWMVFESQGMQKLSKEARALFYNFLPLPADIKDKLKDRGYHYRVLWENDQRKKASRGY
ncbi:MAG: hypothetical protein PHQ23_00325 [Candidatus Wallbacteria bacterium]|nr:hypothetical protein [Candidatus Wallbacteria bacterium]